MITLIAPALERPHKFKVTGIFKTDMYDYDANIVYAGLENLARIFNNGMVSGIGVDCASSADYQQVKIKILERLGRDFIVTTWEERNRNLFSAIKLEKLAMFVILTLIVIVACFGIIGVLVMTVMEKRKDIGILKAIGVSKKGIVSIFSMQGFIIGSAGVTIGLLGGMLASFLLERFVRLPREVYYIDRIPVKFQAMDSFIIVSVALIISLLSSIYPAYKASSLDPVEALRYE
jgi:lipoprotein-releasing system permease protein